MYQSVLQIFVYVRLEPSLVRISEELVRLVFGVDRARVLVFVVVVRAVEVRVVTLHKPRSIGKLAAVCDQSVSDIPSKCDERM